jgi:hypothetical protein
MMRAMRHGWLLLLLLGCGRDPGTQPARADACSITARPFARAAPARVIAIGDVHGDYEATRTALRLAGAIDAEDRWVGGDLAVVQLGDVLDRGDGEQAIIDLFERLETEADAAGGSFTWLLGNHELMNAAGDFRYVTDGGWKDFGGKREAAMRPGGRYARIFAGQDIAVMVGDTVYSHAGFLPTWTADPSAMNRGARCWLDGAGAEPAVGHADDGEPGADCAMLRQTLAALGARRMVVAHTPNPTGITSDCDETLWRIDVGLSAYYGGPIEVLEITEDGARVVRASSR